jgi:hypothetical protein
MSDFGQILPRIIIYTVLGLFGLFALKRLFIFLGFSSKFHWGFINYWIVKKSHQLSHREMKFLRKLAEYFRIPAPSYLVGNITSLDHYIALYIIHLYKRKMNYWARIRNINTIMEIRRKFALIPLASSRIRHSRQLPPGSKVRVGIKGKGYFSGVLGESRYSYFTVSIPSHKAADTLKKEKRVVCRVSRLGDAQYIFNTKVLFVSSMTSPMFAQLKQTRKLRRKQQRRDVRRKTEIFCDIVPVNPTKTKKGYIFVEDIRNKMSAYIKDISSGGAAVTTRDTLQPGKYYRIKFRLLGEELEVPGRVLRYNKINKYSEKGIGHFKFTGIPLNAKVMIQLYVYRLHPNFFKK